MATSRLTDTQSLSLVTHLMFRLLPLQVLLAAVNVTNDIVSSLFASNAVGADAMAAIGLYSPVSSLVAACGILFASGSQILGSQYMGRGQIDKTRAIFVLNIFLTCAFSAIMIILHVIAALSGFAGSFSDDADVSRYLSDYVLGKALGLLPLVMGMQLAAFLSMENQMKLTTLASVVFIIVNIIFHALFVVLLDMQALGLALAGSLGSWVFALILFSHYARGKSALKLNFKEMPWGESLQIFKLGSPEALTTLYFAIRALILNALIVTAAGNTGLAAYTTVYTFFFIFWALPDGMLAVSRMLIGVSVGEEDRQTLTNIMRVVFRRYAPLVLALSLAVCLCAEPLTNLYYQNPSSDVYQMTLWGFRIFPWCMVLSLIATHFYCCGNTLGKKAYVHTMTLLEGLVCVPVFSFLLVPYLGVSGVFLAYVLRGVTTCGLTVLYAWYHNGHFPRNMAELLVLPDDFGVLPDARLDLDVRSIEEVVTVSQQVRAFCERRGVDRRRSMLSGLCLEEMAGNVVRHGFTADKKRHGIDIRVVHKDDDLILRIKDDCIQFDPAERAEMMDPEDKSSNIGIRMVYGIATQVNYQHILGMNVLTMRI